MTNKNGKNKINKRQPVWSGTRRFLKLFFKKPQIVSLSGEIPNKAIYLANHAAMFGPLIYNFFLPAKVAPWAAYPMMEGYKSRFHYLRDVYFMQKRHKPKSTADFLASFEAMFNIYFYRGLRAIPSYNDTRFIKTIRQSIQMLENDIGVIIFPEDSNDGYHEVLTNFYAGFVELAKYYQRQYGEDIPIYPVYYHNKRKMMVIGEPHVLTEYTNRGLSRQEIAGEFCRQVNNLFFNHIKNPTLTLPEPAKE